MVEGYVAFVYAYINEEEAKEFVCTRCGFLLNEDCCLQNGQFFSP
jgi:hypothetical protein